MNIIPKNKYAIARQVCGEWEILCYRPARYRSEDPLFYWSTATAITRYIKVSWHPDHAKGVQPGDDWPDEGWNSALIPVGCATPAVAVVEATFEAETSQPASCIGHYSEDKLYDADGNLDESGAGPILFDHGSHAEARIDEEQRLKRPGWGEATVVFTCRKCGETRDDPSIETIDIGSVHTCHTGLCTECLSESQ